MREACVHIKHAKRICAIRSQELHPLEISAPHLPKPDPKTELNVTRVHPIDAFRGALMGLDIGSAVTIDEPEFKGVAHRNSIASRARWIERHYPPRRFQITQMSLTEFQIMRSE